jgi:hypothetical protein
MNIVLVDVDFCCLFAYLFVYFCIVNGMIGEMKRRNGFLDHLAIIVVVVPAVVAAVVVLRNV